MILECFKNKKFRTLWSAGCMTGVARAMEFLALSIFILQDIGIEFLITIVMIINRTKNITVFIIIIKITFRYN